MTRYRPAPMLAFMTKHQASDRTIHDVVVVGARSAGASTAMLLARMGHDVVVADRATFPSDTLSTHALSRSGVVQLQRWGLLDRVLASGTPAIRQISFHMGGKVINRSVGERAGVDLLVAPRRLVFDELLLAASAEAGAEPHTGITIREVTRDGTGRVDGVVGSDATGNEVRIRARYVVGADGLRSRIARVVEAPIVDERHRSGAALYAYVAGLGAEEFEFHLADRRFGGVFPTHGEEAAVWLTLPASNLPPLGQGSRRARTFVDLIDEASPSLGDRLRTAQLASPVRVATNMPNQVRHPVGPGWALVGDAGYFRDAITGHGMSDAFRDAELLALALDAALRGEMDERIALAGYRAERDRALAETFDVACELAEHPDVPERLALLKRLTRAVDEEADWLAGRPAPPLAPALVA
jgi:2-polyprenyl-6-methoxyphenol hydroxylase-like FAD-dependent oxidoreductase